MSLDEVEVRDTMMSNFQRLALLAAMVLAVVVSGCTTCARTEPKPQPLKVEATPEQRALAVKSEMDFAFLAYAKLRLPGRENFFYSPYSLWEALAMTYAGSSAETKTQMAKALQFGASEPTIHAAIKSMNLKFHESGIDGPGFQLKIANTLWGQEGFKFLDPFLTSLKDNYGAELRFVDFMNNAEGARLNINGWVEKATEQRIKDIIFPGALSKDTRLVLTNAIYLKGKWINAFKKADTHPEQFQITEGFDPNKCNADGVCTEIGFIGPNYISADMMKTTANFRVAETDEYTAVEMPYVGNKFAMLAILPKRPPDVGPPGPSLRIGLDELEKKLSGDYLQRIKGGLKEGDVALSFPKFKIESESDPVKALKALGMEDAFDSRADFSLMKGDTKLYLSDVLHKALVLVDEEGTEAAAATAVIVGELSTSIKPEVKVIEFNRPFVCLIWDKETGAIFFLGHVTNPKGI